MPSSPSPSLGLEEQATGENLNTWGALLDRMIGMVDAAVAGMATIALTGNYTLTSTLYAANEARNAALKLTGTAPWTVTIPNVTKVYLVWNASSAIQTISAGALSATVQVGELVLLFCDAANVRRVIGTDFGGLQITNVADPTTPQGVATKAFVEALAFAYDAGNLPGQLGNAGKYVTTDGTTASWQFVPITSVTGLSANAGAVRVGTTTGTALTPGDTYNALATVALTDAATIAVDMATFLNGSVTLGGNRTLGNPTNTKPGQTGIIAITQDATGSRTLSFASNWKRAGGAPTLTTTPAATDVLVYQVLSSTYILYDIVKNPS